MTNRNTILQKLRDAIITLDIDSIPSLCMEALNTDISPFDVVMEGMAKGMDVVGQRYEAGEYFLADLVMAGETMKEGMSVLEPYLENSKIKKAGKCVIGTVKGDFHDIGKNVFVSLLKAQNYEIIDLGVDVTSKQFIEAVKEYKPDILAMSALLTITMGEMENVVNELERQDLRKGVKVILGGAPLTQEYATKIGADAVASDAVEGVRVIRSWE